MTNWPPDYLSEIQGRIKRIEAINSDPSLAVGAYEYYRTRRIEFIRDWCITYDPRNAGRGIPQKMPFIPFPRQYDLVSFLDSCLINKTNGLIEKSRDMGATWICAAFSVHAWIYSGGAAIGWGSRKEMLVDRVGDPDSIFEKMRMMINELPRFFWPKGFDPRQHMTYMKIINPENGATITGEAGDNIGRGGRKTIYFKDESAHYERPELIESALGDNTNVQIDISSVNGTGNVFYRRRMAGEVWSGDGNVNPRKTQIFVMDWRDHPAKDQEWYDGRRERAEQEGLLHIFAQEVDRDYASAVEGVVIPSAWVKSAIDAHIKLGIEPSGLTYAGQDIADEGGDKNALAIRTGILLRYSDEWGEGDTGDTARKSVRICSENKVDELHYDCIGVGSGFKAETNRMSKVGEIPKSMKIVKWDASSSPQNPDKRVVPGDPESKKNKDFYANMKAQAWWELRRRFERTHKAVTKGEKYDPDELISIPSGLEDRHQIENELSQPTYSHNGSGKIVIDKKPNGTKSPNRADSVVMAYFPAKSGGQFFA